MPHLEILFFFFVVAFIYASVGFGGGSSYLAILALYALPFKEMRLIALICNIIVVTGGGELRGRRDVHLELVIMLGRVRPSRRPQAFAKQAEAGGSQNLASIIIRGLRSRFALGYFPTFWNSYQHSGLSV